MDAVTNTSNLNSTELKTLVHASDLVSLLQQYANKIKVLSLDCFDTLILRSTATPTDVFYNMQNKQLFSELNITAQVRAKSEANARATKAYHYGTSEVSLAEIYRESFPDAEDHIIEQLVNDEIETELETCYAFPPTIELIRAAKKLGLQVIIVSDTYLKQDQLRHLLQLKLPSDAYDAINHVFCSCEHGYSKAGGLFKPVLEKLNLNPTDVLHLGDSLVSDFNSARKLGMYSHQLQMIDPTLNEILRMQSVASSYLDPRLRVSKGMPSPFHGVLAANKYGHETPEDVLGYAAVGPIMYAFSRFLCNEFEEIKKNNKSVKILFLMRDAYLPSLVCEAISGKPVGHRIRISRFSAYASSFKDTKAIEHYLKVNTGTSRLYDMCKQFLLPERIRTQILKKVEKAKNKYDAFGKEIYRPDVLQIIYKNSAEYRKRMMKHLEKEADVKPGDTLVFVDLGYTGNTQLVLQQILKDEYNINILGRYLIQLNIPSWNKTRRGLIDPSWCDDRTMNMLVTYIALLEQISTSNDMSVVDYEEDGTPIFSESGISKSQHQLLHTIQERCIKFANDAETFFKNSNTKLSEKLLKESALIGLGRLLFIPTENELKYLKSFQFDLSLGTTDLLKVFDEEAGLAGLRKRGLFFMEMNLKTMRTNYPAELRSAGLELVLMLMSQFKSSGDIRANDFSHRRETITLVVAKGNQSTQLQIQATPTYDGYYSLIIPIATGDLKIGIQFGSTYDWVQIDSADIIPANTLYSATESEHTIDASEYLGISDMVDHSGGLFSCTSEIGMIVFSAEGKLEPNNYILRIVFRPTVKKQVNETQK